MNCTGEEVDVAAFAFHLILICNRASNDHLPLSDDPDKREWIKKDIRTAIKDTWNNALCPGCFLGKVRAIASEYDVASMDVLDKYMPLFPASKNK